MAKFGDFSPVGGMLTGEGLMGKLAASGAVGLGPQAIAKNAQDDEEEKKKKAGMKEGGAVRSSASKRADGCAVRGKTRGKIV
jgi:hypothetical protein